MYEQFIGKRMTVEEINECIPNKDVFIKDVERDGNNAICAGVVFAMCENDVCIEWLMKYKKVDEKCVMLSTYKVSDNILFL